MSLEALTSLTSKERILIYLSDFHHMEDRYELPPDITQESIAYNCGVQRKHLSQYLTSLIEEGLVSERKAHIRSMRQRMNAYFLTSAGLERTRSLKEDLANLEVPVIVKGRESRMKVSEIDEATSVHITYCDIIREALRTGKLEMANLEQVEKRKREALEKKEQATDSYRRALETAWRDGRVTATERFLIDELRRLLKITEDQHRLLEDEIVKRLAQDHMEFRRMYRQALEVALLDGMLDGPEVDILENLRKSMRISTEEHEYLVEEVKESFCGPSGMESSDTVSRE